MYVSCAHVYVAMEFLMTCLHHTRTVHKYIQHYRDRSEQQTGGGTRGGNVISVQVVVYIGMYMVSTFSSS